jgi:hypothetical protein
VRVFGSFTGEIPGVEFGEGGIDVVGVEQDGRPYVVVGGALDDLEEVDLYRRAVGV